MTVVSIVFGILLITLTLASTQFSPRILVSLRLMRTLGDISSTASNPARLALLEFGLL